MEENVKEVDFRVYCPVCKHYELEETKDPCNECLAQGWNIESHKPIHFEDRRK